AVENDRPVTRGPDHDGPLGSAAGCQVIRAIEQRADAAAIPEAGVLVEPGMHDDHIARLHAWRKGIEPVGVRGPHVERGQQAVERRLLALPLITLRIDMEGASVGGGLRLRPGSYLEMALRLAADPIWIGEGELHLIAGVWLQVEHAAGEHRRRGVIDREVLDLLVTDAQQWQPVAPRPGTARPVTQADGGVAVGIALQRPLQADGIERGRFNDDI